MSLAAEKKQEIVAKYGRGDGPGENIPSWLILDQRYRDRYTFAGITPRTPFPGRWEKAGVLVKAGSISELAEKIGVPAAALTDTVERFNGFARAGKDEDFGRGESEYDHYYGDPRNKPNPSLGVVDKAPFYAFKVVPGDLGTKGGLVTDEIDRCDWSSDVCSSDLDNALPPPVRGRHRDRGALRDGQRRFTRHGTHVRRAGGNDRPRDDLRISGSPRHPRLRSR